MSSLTTEAAQSVSAGTLFTSNSEQRGKTFRIAAGVLVIIYICVQAFQNYVFSAFGVPANACEELLQGAASLHVTRSTLMLISIFALIFMWWVICVQGIRRNSFLALIAFFGFFMFGMFEVALRSVELFWTQIQLPAEYLKATGPLVHAAILDKFTTFQSIQGALYFPLMFGPFLAYFAVFFLFPSNQRIHRALKFTIAFAAARTGMRLLGYAGIHLVNDATYMKFYFAMVLIEYLPRAYWLFRVKDDDF